MSTLMHRETMEIPGLARALLERQVGTFAKTASRLRAFDPHLLLTVARGSSDNAASYFKYLFEIEAGIPVASLGPSVTSVYGRQLKLTRTVCLSISQSGKSPDLIATQAMAKTGGALTIALLNDLDTPLGMEADHVLSVGAGPEKAVAATKSYVMSLIALAKLIADFCQEETLLAALGSLPATLDEALRCNWRAFRETLSPGTSLYVIGRGPGLSVAQEAALKFKETCQIHAESYSSAEVLHGPIQLAGGGFIALVFLARDASRASTIAAIERLAQVGTRVFVVDPASEISLKHKRVQYLPCAPAKHPALDVISQISSFYIMVEQLAASFGLDPDRPALLNKVTRTL
ncbi:SIS domain-containing protein [Limoniibacter endophyticus]|uniref:Glucosamine--fructose-6-phosphate aminotransferase n=1 Tax=Limoniibacter endophyticus TaxID=1565040 RepID=A0A8J3DJG1_9HYPH|nr:SIS domain-containing protein [Limoniibacter endophyticus]GHC78016.1 glucosamine--fructose-6-phosphate aminotransferase [Limoniibacter endophyticus]